MDFASEEVELLRERLAANDVAGVAGLMQANPALHRAPLGYCGDGPLTYVAERGEEWVGMAKWLVENGSDVHQGGDAPLMRAALRGERIPMMEALVELGADVNGKWHEYYPVIYAPCETLEVDALRWLLAHGAETEGAMDYLLGTYLRDTGRLKACMDVLVAHGGTTRYDYPAVLAIVRHEHEELERLLRANPLLVEERYPDLDIGTTAGRMLTLKGATLLHVAAEFGNAVAVRMLLGNGAQVDVPAMVDEKEVGGQTALFHALTQRKEVGREVADLLLARGARLGARAKVPGSYEEPGEVLEVSAGEYGEMFGGG